MSVHMSTLFLTPHPHPKASNPIYDDKLFTIPQKTLAPGTISSPISYCSLTYATLAILILLLFLSYISHVAAQSLYLLVPSTWKIPSPRYSHGLFPSLPLYFCLSLALLEGLPRVLSKITGRASLQTLLSYFFCFSS